MGQVAYLNAFNGTPSSVLFLLRSDLLMIAPGLTPQITGCDALHETRRSKVLDMTAYCSETAVDFGN